MELYCKCGHKKSDHGHIFYIRLPSICLLKQINGGFEDNCRQFIPDNLMTIEMLAKEKGLV
jgi:hypothetical protein